MEIRRPAQDRPAFVKLRRDRHLAFTLVELMIAVMIIAILAVVALPAFLRARKRSQASQVVNELRLIDAAVNEYAIETGKLPGATVSVADWTNYIKKDSRLYLTGEDVLGNEYGAQTVDETPFVPIETYFELGDVADDDFWDPFNP